MDKINWLGWFKFLSNLGLAVAQSEGKDTRAVKYLGVAVQLGDSVVATQDDLAELEAKYAAEVAADTPTTASELDAIAARIKARSDQIQSP